MARRLRQSTIGWLQGGLGNQLFQLNAALAASRLAECPLVLATSGFRHLNDREWELGPLTRDIPTLSRFEHMVVRPYSKLGKLKGRLHGTGLRVARSISEATEPGTVLVGFFQDSTSLANAVTPTLERLKAARRGPVPREVLDRVSDSVAVHVRRGDYVSMASSVKTFGTTTLEYFVRGLEALDVKPVDALYFTDDPEWVASNFAVERDRIVASAEIQSPLDTMLTMADARGLVMPNSTFSWWASELVLERGGRVAGPATWFFDRDDSKSLVRPRWIHIDNA